MAEIIEIKMKSEEADPADFCGNAPQRAQADDSLGGIIGASEAITTVKERIKRIAATDATILITGESGTGKELVARAIHELSGRKGIFVAVNCAALPETLIESELFGHTRGSFSGASTSRAGKFEAANDGTIFLDEIGDMPLGAQAKILRVLQEKNYCRLGSNKEHETSARVIAATNQNLMKAVRQETFREDLFYRLNVIAIRVPPLRERMEDVRPLSEFFFERVCVKNAIAVETLNGVRDAFFARAMILDWPGNVRELENAITSAVLFGETEKEADPATKLSCVKDESRPRKNGYRSEFKELSPFNIFFPFDGRDLGPAKDFMLWLAIKHSGRYSEMAKDAAIAAVKGKGYKEIRLRLIHIAIELGLRPKLLRLRKIFFLNLLNTGEFDMILEGAGNKMSLVSSKIGICIREISSFLKESVISEE